jgi:zinc/manganese transport system substrate-binding protein
MRFRIPFAAALIASLPALLAPNAADAAVKAVVTYPYIESILKEVGGDRVEISVLAKGNEDPHFVVARPSFIGRLRMADLLVINGASLGIGFVPPLIRQASNNKILPGSAGFLDLSQYVELIDKPQKVSRAEGDVHPEGNPHFILDWHNVPAVAKALSDKLAEVDPAGTEFYAGKLKSFLERWQKKSDELDKKAEGLKGKTVFQYHRLFNYFAGRAGIKIAGELEPKPGIQPTGKHIEELISEAPVKKVFFVMADAYHEQKSPEVLAQKLGIPWAVIPQDVGAVPGAKDIFSLYDTMLGSLLK